MIFHSAQLLIYMHELLNADDKQQAFSSYNVIISQATTPIVRSHSAE